MATLLQYDVWMNETVVSTELDDFHCKISFDGKWDEQDKKNTFWNKSHIFTITFEYFGIFVLMPGVNIFYFLLAICMDRHWGNPKEIVLLINCMNYVGSAFLFFSLKFWEQYLSLLVQQGLSKNARQFFFATQTCTSNLFLLVFSFNKVFSLE